MELTYPWQAKWIVRPYNAVGTAKGVATPALQEQQRESPRTRC